MRNFAGSVALVLSACSSQPTEDDASSSGGAAISEATDPRTQSRSPAASAVEPVESGAVLPPADAKRRYVGRWATRADLCGGGAWIFTSDHLGLEDGPMCGFTEVEAIPGGYRVAARCDGRGSESAESFTLRFAESARAMLVEGMEALPDTGLIYCGPA